MFGNARFDRVRQIFADQFEPDGDTFLYRKSGKAAPVRVSAVERDAFIADFNRRLGYSVWLLLAVTILLIGLLVIAVPDDDIAGSQFYLYTGMTGIMALYFIGYFWAWNGPARELERRPRAGFPRSREEVRRRAFAKMTYQQLGFLVGAAVLLVGRASNVHDLFHGWGIFRLVFAVIVLVVAGVQAIRK